MSHPSPGSDEFGPLLSKLLDEQLDADEQLRFILLLREDAGARAQYHRTLTMHALLQWQIGSADEPSHLEAPYSNKEKELGSASAAATIRQHPYLVSIAAAALSLALVLGVLGMIYLPAHAPRQTVSRVNGGFAAQLTGEENLRWDEAATPWGVGRRLPAGTLLHLAEGLAEVTFNDGAVVAVQGPAKFRVLSPSGAELAAGKVRVRLEREATHFSLDAPQARIVDLGTEFGALVDETGQTSIHVFEGAVAASLLNTDGMVREQVELSAGSSAIVRPAADHIDTSATKFASLFTRVQLPPLSQRVRIANPSFEHPPTRKVGPLVDWRGVKQSGVFHNQAGFGELLTNVDGEQLAYMNTAPGREISQDISGRYFVGNAYTLTVGLAARSDRPGVQGATMEVQLYFRDDASKPQVVASTTVSHEDLSDSHLQDVSVTLPKVKPSDLHAGKQIGIRFRSVTGGNGDWTLDNVRLTVQPEQIPTLNTPAS